MRVFTIRIHGSLPERLNALGSAIAFASLYQRQLRVYWSPDCSPLSSFFCKPEVRPAPHPWAEPTVFEEISGDAFSCAMGAGIAFSRDLPANEVHSSVWAESDTNFMDELAGQPSSPYLSRVLLVDSIRRRVDAVLREHFGDVAITGVIAREGANLSEAQRRVDNLAAAGARIYLSIDDATLLQALFDAYPDYVFTVPQRGVAGSIRAGQTDLADLYILACADHIVGHACPFSQLAARLQGSSYEECLE